MNKDGHTSSIRDKILTINVKRGWKPSTRITFTEEGDQGPNNIPGKTVLLLAVCLWRPVERLLRRCTYSGRQDIHSLLAVGQNLAISGKQKPQAQLLVNTLGTSLKPVLSWKQHQRGQIYHFGSRLSRAITFSSIFTQPTTFNPESTAKPQCQGCHFVHSFLIQIYHQITISRRKCTRFKLSWNKYSA